MRFLVGGDAIGKRIVMIWITVAVTLFVFGYLLVALLRPEKF
jgi:K+-transporting ATPase KdpF subunit